MNMNKENKAFFIVFDNHINDNPFCHSEIQKILNLEAKSKTSNITSSCINKTHYGLIKDSKMQKLLAFTLSESLIMMAIVGIITVITMTSLSGLKPNKDKMLLQNAYRASLNAVAEITNDPVAYPPLKNAYAVNELNALFTIRREMELALGTPELTQALTSNVDCTIIGTTGGITGGITGAITDQTTNMLTTIATDLIMDNAGTNNGGFTLNPSLTLHPTDAGHNDSVLPNIGSAGETKASGSVTITPASAVLTDRSVPTRDSGKYTSANKFAYLFAHIMQPSGKDISCNSNICTFNTANGMSWTVTDDFSDSNVDSTATIKVDINGDKKPNKAYNPSNPSEVKNPDQFTFTVRANGQVVISETDVTAQKYLQTRDVN